MIEYYSSKVEQIVQSAIRQAGTRGDLARLKMIFALIFSMIETKSVQFPELATKLNVSAQDESNLRRIQAFFAYYPLDYRVIAYAMMSFGVGLPILFEMLDKKGNSMPRSGLICWPSLWLCLVRNGFCR